MEGLAPDLATVWLLARREALARWEKRAIGIIFSVPGTIQMVYYYPGCRTCTRACPVLRQSGWPRADHPDHTQCVTARGDVVWRVRVNQPTGLGHVLTDLNRAPWGSPVGTRACEVKPLSRGDIGTVGVQSRGASAPTVCPLARPVERSVDRGPVRSAVPNTGGISMCWRCPRA